MGILAKLGSGAPEEKQQMIALKASITHYKTLQKKLKDELQKAAKEIRPDIFKREIDECQAALEAAARTDSSGALIVNVNAWVKNQRAFLAMLQAFEKGKFKAFFKSVSKSVED
jgi:hypothetical protein